jgi:hypothetical protein
MGRVPEQELTPRQNLDCLLNQAERRVCVVRPLDENGRAILIPAPGWKFREGGVAQMPIQVGRSDIRFSSGEYGRESKGYHAVLTPTDAATLVRGWVVQI